LDARVYPGIEIDLLEAGKRFFPEKGGIVFGKKKAPLPPYVLQVLTTEYLIEGTFAGDGYLSVGTFLRLAPAQIQSTRSASVPPQVLTQFTVAGEASVAFIPRTEITQLLQYSVWKEYKNAMPGTFYVGPYVMKGRLMGFSTGLLDKEPPIFDVHITCPGTGWAGLYAPLAVINIHRLHGYIPD
jgi:hypothetical protein